MIGSILNDQPLCREIKLEEASFASNDSCRVMNLGNDVIESPRMTRRVIEFQ